MSTMTTYQQERFAAAAGGARALDVVPGLACKATDARRPWTANPTFVVASKHGITHQRPEEAVP